MNELLKIIIAVDAVARRLSKVLTRLITNQWGNGNSRSPNTSAHAARYCSAARRLVFVYLHPASTPADSCCVLVIRAITRPARSGKATSHAGDLCGSARHRLRLGAVASPAAAAAAAEAAPLDTDGRLGSTFSSRGRTRRHDAESVGGASAALNSARQ